VENPDTPPEITEQFWSSVLAYETAGQTTHYRQLQEDGIELPPPDELDDAALTAKLWEIIHALARRNVFMSRTDHWSDRELYEHLVHDTLHEVTADFPPDSGWNCHIDFLSAAATRTTNCISNTTPMTSGARSGTRTFPTTPSRPRRPALRPRFHAAAIQRRPRRAVRALTTPPSPFGRGPG